MDFRSASLTGIVVPRATTIAPALAVAFSIDRICLESGFNQRRLNNDEGIDGSVLVQTSSAVHLPDYVRTFLSELDR